MPKKAGRGGKHFSQGPGRLAREREDATSPQSKLISNCSGKGVSCCPELRAKAGLATSIKGHGHFAIREDRDSLSGRGKKGGRGLRRELIAEGESSRKGSSASRSSRRDGEVIPCELHRVIVYV